jgi:hypothetical protein
MYTYSNANNPISPSLSTSEMETSATPASTSLPASNQSDLDLSTDSLPPSPKQPRINPEVSTVVNVNVADLAKRRNTLTE